MGLAPAEFLNTLGRQLQLTLRSSEALTCTGIPAETPVHIVSTAGKAYSIYQFWLGVRSLQGTFSYVDGFHNFGS